jgi:hypothetical protein
MLCGADVVGPVQTGVLTTYCMAFKRGDKPVYALWRVAGEVEAEIAVDGSEAAVTDSMGNPRKVATKDGKVKVTLGPSVTWLEGVSVKSFAFDEPKYDEKPAKQIVGLAEFTADRWSYDGSANEAYANNHFAVARVTDPALTVTFDKKSAAVTLAKQPAGDRPLAQRYGAIVAKTPIAIPGKASALGVWIDGNSSWGRIAYQLRDAKGELWTSIGTPDDWNCDDIHTWSFVKFEGTRYVRFPLPSNLPYDGFREAETTWWKHEQGDGIVDLPLAVERIFVEARNEVHYLGQMRLVPERSYIISNLTAEYAGEASRKAEALAAYKSVRPTPAWQGPTDNPIARMREQNAGDAPVIHDFEEPGHFNDGRRMHIRFEEKPATTYNLYLSRFPDGRGAELLKAGIKDKLLVAGLRPGIKMYLYLTAIGADKKESKPSEAFELTTTDKFREK